MNPIPKSGRSLLAVALLVSSALCAQAKVLTLTKAIIDHNNSRIDFGLPTIPVPPTGSTPWTHGLAAGDTIEIEGHTRKQLVLSRITQGTVANPVRITNASGAQFIIDSNDVNFLKGFTLSGCSRFVLYGTAVGTAKGIVIARTPPDASGVVVTQHGGGTSGYPLTGATDFEVHDIEISNTGFAGVLIKCDGLKEASGFVMQNVKLHHLVIHDTGGEGMYVGSSSFTSVADDPHHIHNLHIHDNKVTNTGWDGIQVGCATQNTLIERNVIKGFGLTTTLSAQDEGMRINPGTAGIIRGNWIEGTNAGAGMGILANPYDDSLYYNNVIVSPGENGIDINTDYGMLAGTTIQIFNNTIVTPGLAGVHFRSQIAVDSIAFNNLIADPGSAAFTTMYSPDFTEVDNYVAATVAEVGFILSPDTSKYRLSPSAVNAIDRGSLDPDLPGPSSDYDGIPRPQGTRYDIGAFEYPVAATGLITPAGYGQAGTAYCPAAGAFNEQPSWNAGSGVPTGVSASPYTATGTAYANRHWYIDFGPNWANLRITGTWTRYMPLTTGSYSGFGVMWWDNDNDAVNDGVTATGLNFCTAQGLNTGSTQPWVRDTNATAAPITPQGRYLIINTGTAPAARVNEFAISGYTVN